ncbi:zinc ribbon-containing protein [Sulfuriflexus sp.]|uniref:zinc ribbon-containing protein n=1 Tax=Sulfuriflexus sp. TaxID=2015443 RepID=UPI0028CD2E60|nr:zinc ribbon-containing protein [Sulfuriflexus sp.]MDT8404473.1 zinc ribbon-containing protein [Sulfuriflexus sp.]
MPENTPLNQKFVDAYNKMLERLHVAMDEVGHHARPDFREQLRQAAEKASELGELGREEAHEIAGYLQRDIHDAAQWLAENGDELKFWLRFDIELVESRLFNAMNSVADKTRLELKKLEEQAGLTGEWKTGEISGIGTLVCKNCGELLHFHTSGHIPPCPKCHGTAFKRASHSAD